jgi:hypothetical protein
MDPRCPDDFWTVEIQQKEPHEGVVVYKDAYSVIRFSSFGSITHTIVAVTPLNDWARYYPRDVLRRDAILERIMQGLLCDKPRGYVAEIDKDECFITIREPETGSSA